MTGIFRVPAESAMVERVRQRLSAHDDGRTVDSVNEALREERRLFDAADRLSVVDALHVDRAQAGPLQSFLDDPDVTDVLVNGTSGVWVDRGTGPEPVGRMFTEDAQVRRLAQRLAGLAGRRVDDASPWVDGRLPDGTRLHVVLAPIAHPGTVISLRVPARSRLSLDELVANGAVDPVMEQQLRQIIATRRSFLVTGGTGTGKTTVLAALLAEVPSGERLVVVEDSAELRPAHPHVVALEGRPPNVEGVGAVTMRDLVRQALRMRPDRIVVGEVRGAEIADLLAALNTGHEGGCGTVHANGPAQLPARLAALGAMAGLDRDTTWLQVASAIDRVVHVGRTSTGTRAVLEVAALAPEQHGRLVVDTIHRREGQR